MTELRIQTAAKPTSARFYVVMLIIFSVVFLAGVGIFAGYLSQRNATSGLLYIAAAAGICGLFGVVAFYYVYFRLMTIPSGQIFFGLAPVLVMLGVFIIFSILFIVSVAHLCPSSAYWDPDAETCVSGAANTQNIPGCGVCLQDETCIAGKCCPPTMQCGNAGCCPPEHCSREGTCCPNPCGKECCAAVETCTAEGTCCQTCGVDEKGAPQCCPAGTTCVSGACVIQCGSNICPTGTECVVVAGLSAADQAAIVAAGGTVGPDPGNPARDVAFICKNTSGTANFSLPATIPAENTGRYLCSRFPATELCFPANPTTQPLSDYPTCAGLTDAAACNASASPKCTWVDLLAAATDPENNPYLEQWITDGFDGSTEGYYCSPDGDAYGRIVSKSAEEDSVTWEDCLAASNDVGIRTVRWNQDTGICSYIQDCQAADSAIAQYKLTLKNGKPDSSEQIPPSVPFNNPTGNVEDFPVCPDTSYCNELDPAVYICQEGTDGTPSGAVIKKPIKWICSYDPNSEEGISQCVISDTAEGYDTKEDCQNSYANFNAKQGYAAASVKCETCRNNCGIGGVCNLGQCTCAAGYDKNGEFNFDCSAQCDPNAHWIVDGERAGTKIDSSDWQYDWTCPARDGEMSYLCSGGQWTIQDNFNFSCLKAGNCCKIPDNYSPGTCLPIGCSTSNCQTPTEPCSM